MKIKKLNCLLEDLFLAEDKSHLINKTNLTPEQKQEVIQHFKKYPHKEKLITWQNLDKLSYKDFEKVMNVVSKRKEEKDFKQLGLESLTKGKDYVVLYNSPSIQAIMPLNYKSSKFIASKYLGGCTGQWCTAYQKTNQHWTNYTKSGIKFAYFIDMKEEKTFGKIAMAYREEYGDVEYYNSKDELISESNVYILISKKIIERAKKIMSLVKNVDAGKNELTFDLLKKQKVNYSIDKYGYVNVKGDCYLRDLELESFGDIQFGEVTGSFVCSGNDLKSLKGCPKKVGGNFLCLYNDIRNLEGGPEEVAGSYLCHGNQLFSLKGAPKVVGGTFSCYLDYLATLEWVPGIVKEKIDFGNSFQNSNFTISEIRKAFNVERGIILW